MKFFPVLLLLMVSLVGKVHAQQEDSIPAWTVGLAVGYYVSGDATASYYNADDAGINFGNSESRLQNLLTNPQTEPKIRESLGGYNFELSEYANDMRYNSTAAFDLQLSYNFNKGWMFSMYFRSVKLTAAGIFTLLVERTSQPNSTEPFLERANISGKESRSHIGLGVGKKFPFRENFYTLVEAGLDMNFVEVEQNIVEIAGQTYTLPTYNDPLNYQATEITTFGTGFFAAAGIGYQLPGQWGFLLKANYLQTSIDVNKIVQESIPVFLPTLGFSRSF